MAVPIPSILEIGRSFKFHPVRGAPGVIDGLINLRGKVVTIVNLGLAFEEKEVLAGDESRIFIFKNNSELSEVADSGIEIETRPTTLAFTWTVFPASSESRTKNCRLSPRTWLILSTSTSFDGRIPLPLSWSLPRFSTYTKTRIFYHERAKGHQVQHLQPHHHL